MNIKNAINSVQNKIDTLIDLGKNNLPIVGAGAGLVVLLAAGLYGYHYFGVQKEQAANTVLGDCMSQFDQAAQGKASFADVATMCQAGYEKFKNTKVAPYMLAIQVDALLGEQKQQEALDTINTMLAQISSSSPLYPLYSLKQALLKIDMPDEAINQSGLQELEKLAADTSNIYNDAAQFYVGFYYNTHGNAQKAKEVWTNLVAINDTVTDDQGRSPWAAMAQEKMNGLS
jgi:hypothetical protein